VKYEGELSTQEARAMIDSLKAFGAPVLLFSGGEPLLREDLFELNAYARSCGLRTVISTNGTLITSEMAERIHEAGFEYIGVSLDGIGKNNDRFRGKIGAFDAALSGVRNLVAVGQKVGLRFTITRHNYKEIPRLFELVETEGVARICFYHLAYAGRGADLQKEDLSHADTRAVVEGIMRWSRSLIDRGIHKEVLTVDNHADGALLYLHLLKDDPARAKEVYGLLRANGGNASGISIANVDNLGYVHPDQFWHDVTFGNVRERSFGDIWMDKSHPMMGKLKDRTRYLKGRCARCRFLDICDGNLRLRAEVIGDVWGDDPACYLTDDEIYRTEVPGV
jgi:radical SAM protein with 4Fe4S-binding SPASM domain